MGCSSDADDHVYKFLFVCARVMNELDINMVAIWQVPLITTHGHQAVAKIFGYFPEV